MYKNSRFGLPMWIKRLLAVTAVLMFAVLPTNRGWAYPSQDPHAKILGGPYELMVKRGMQGAEMFYPVNIEDTSTQNKLDSIFPVMGSSAKIKLEEFLPDLVWEQYTKKSKEGGLVIKLKAVGPNLDQVLWLCAEETDRQSVSSAIGGMSIKKIGGKIDIKETSDELGDPNVVGILTVWDDDPNVPMVYMVSEGSDIQVKGTPYQIKVLEYMPHYSVDMGTKVIQNASSEPMNPAVRIRCTEGDNQDEQWFFSRFSSHPHIANQVPLHVEFADLDPGSRPGNYIVLVSPESSPLVVYRQGDTRRIESLELNKPYPLAGEGYNFIVEDFFPDAILKQRWKNDRNQLLNPAVIATVDWDELKETVVLELNKPQHIRSDSETMVLLYRRKVELMKHLE